MRDTTWFECDECGQDFDVRDDCVDHIMDEHNPILELVVTHDERNVEPHGL